MRCICSLNLSGTAMPKSNPFPPTLRLSKLTHSLSNPLSASTNPVSHSGLVGLNPTCVHGQLSVILIRCTSSVFQHLGCISLLEFRGLPGQDLPCVSLTDASIASSTGLNLSPSKARPAELFAILMGAPWLSVESGRTYAQRRMLSTV